MKLLADENFPPSLISYLQKNHHDVKRVQRATKGISDINIREKAKHENRIIITFDKDFLVTNEIEVPTNTMVLDFPRVKPEEIVPFLDAIVQTIKQLKRKKKPFVAVYSKKGLELISG